MVRIIPLVLLVLAENKEILKGVENQFFFGLNFLIMTIPPTMKATPTRI